MDEDMCGAEHPARDVQCDRPAGHDGAHTYGHDPAYKWGGIGLERL